MKTEQARRFRVKLGKALHDFYIEHGEEEYEKLIGEMGDILSAKYDDTYSTENLRIMEAEYVTFNTEFNECKFIHTKDTIKE